MDYTKPKFNTGDRVRFLKKDIPFRNGYKPQCTDEVLKTTAIFTSSKISKKKKFWEIFMRKS